MVPIVVSSEEIMLPTAPPYYPIMKRRKSTIMLRYFTKGLEGYTKFNNTILEKQRKKPASTETYSEATVPSPNVLRYK
jgi:hypothetical protein